MSGPPAEVTIECEDGISLSGDLVTDPSHRGLVLFAHGSGSSRLSPRNAQVAESLNDRGFATLLFDLLTKEEEAIDMRTGELRFDIPLLAQRLVAATDWVAGGRSEPLLPTLPLGYFGASTGAAAALVAATERASLVKAVVSRGGRPDLADSQLPNVKSATLLIVGGADAAVIELNRIAFERLSVEKRLEIVPGASHLFEESGALEKVAEFAGDWFDQHLRG